MMKKLYTDRVYMCSRKVCAPCVYHILNVLGVIKLLQLQAPAFVIVPLLPLPFIANMVQAMKGGKSAPVQTTAMKTSPMKGGKTTAVQTTAMKTSPMKVAIAMPMKKPATPMKPMPAPNQGSKKHEKVLR